MTDTHESGGSAAASVRLASQPAGMQAHRPGTAATSDGNHGIAQTHDGTPFTRHGSAQRNTTTTTHDFARELLSRTPTHGGRHRATQRIGA